MYRYITIVVLIIAFAITGVACDNNSDGNKFGGRTWSSSLSQDDEALERAIIADIMGGIASDAINPSEMTLTGLSSLNEPEASKISISVPLERSLIDVVNTYTYADPLGVGTLTINVDGEVEEINAYSQTKKRLRFYPIEVVFSFDNYVYTNSCGLQATVTGNINCRLQGEANRETDAIEAIGSCSTGTKGMTGTILYRLSEEEYHDVFIQATVRADGPWYELTSYQFYGSYMLDRRSGTLDSIIAKPPQICEY